MNYTSNYGLKKPETTDFYNVGDFNDNADILDSILQAIPNPNLLDNPWFKINQRGLNEYDGEGYGLDRWKAVNPSHGEAVSVVLTDEGVQFACVGQSNYCRFIQNVANWESLKGKTVTFSVNVISKSGNAVRIQIADGATTPAATANINGDGIATLTTEIASNATNVEVRIIADNTNQSGVNANVVFDKAKLELGSVSTLAGDIRPDEGLELLKCMRYFQRITCKTSSYYLFGSGMAASATVARVNVPFVVPMREEALSASIQNLSVVRNNLSASSPASAVSILTRSAHGAWVAFATTGLTAGEQVFAQINQNGFLDFSAEL